MRFSFRPTEGAFYELFTRAAQNLVRGTELLNELARKRLLAQMLGRIGDRCREMLHRFYINDEGTDTIASELGLARGSVKVMMFKCRQRALEAYRSIMERS